MTTNRAETKGGGGMTLVERLRALAKDLYDCGLYRRAGILEDLTDEVDGKVLVPVKVADLARAALSQRHEDSGLPEFKAAADALAEVLTP